jgi:hypothetical protein
MSTLPHSCINTGTTLTGQPAPPCLACAEMARGPAAGVNDPGPFGPVGFTGPVVITGPSPSRFVGRDT